MSESESPKRQGLVRKAKRWLRRPGTFKLAMFIVKVLNLIVRVFELLK